MDVKPLSAPEAAYIAGLIDGEGTITLTRKHRNENRQLAVTISNTEKSLLDYVLKAIGAGKITGKRTTREHHTPSFTYALYNRQALNLLKQIHPYLKTYKSGRSALILQDYLTLTPRNGKYTDLQRQAREEFESAVLAIKPDRKIEKRATPLSGQPFSYAWHIFRQELHRTRSVTMSYFTKRYHPPGTSPGTLVTEEKAEEFRIQLLDYTPSEFLELTLEHPQECQPYLEKKSITWVHVEGVARAETVRVLGNLFGLHPLALEDVINTGQRPKADSYDEQLFVVMNLPTVSEQGEIETEQVSLFLGDGFLISFHRGNSRPFEPVVQRLRKHSGKIRERKADYLLYALLDVIIDLGFPVLEFYSEYIEDLEIELLENPGKETLAKIHQLKRELLMLRRMLWPQREVINNLLREELPQIRQETLPYLRDCYDHTIQIIDLIEVYREMTSSMMDVYLSSLSNRMNEVMKVLTVIATIFIPLTFIAGVYGMNFAGDSPWAMPELEWYYSYPILWLIMIAIAGGMVVYFRRRNWF